MNYRDETRNPKPDPGQHMSYRDFTRGNPSNADINRVKREVAEAQSKNKKDVHRNS